MKHAIFELSLDVHRRSAQAVWCVRLGETARTLRAVLTENGRPYPIAPDCTAVFAAKKPDGLALYNACRIADGAIEYPLTVQTTNVPGRLDCELRLYGPQRELLTSPRFTLLVDEAVYADGDVIDSTSEGSALTALLRRADEALEAFRTRHEPYTEIEKLSRRKEGLWRTLRIRLRGLEPFDDGHLRLALWRCSRARKARYGWFPARALSNKEDHGLGYGRLRGYYSSGELGGPEYPPVPDWMPDAGQAQAFYNIYAEDGSLLPYVDIPLEQFVLPLVKPVGVLPDRSGWDGEPWKKCGVVGVKRDGTLPLRFEVEREDGSVVARCRNTLTVGARNTVARSASRSLLTRTDTGYEANLRDWYFRVS